MGMSGSTEHVDELMSRSFCDLVESGVVIRIADDLYAGGNSISELLYNWEKILQRFEINNLRLSAPKTVICPSSTTVLGWVRSKGHIRVSPHKVSPLATASPPKTVRGLRSWIGAFRHFKPCLPKHATLLNDLEAVTAGQESKSCIKWSDDLRQAFSEAQSALQRLKSIAVPPT